MLLKEAGAMRHMTSDDSRSQERWALLLTQRVFDELPTDLRMCNISVSSTDNLCLLENTATECVNSIAVHITRSLMLQRLCVAAQSFPALHSVGSFAFNQKLAN